MKLMFKRILSNIATPVPVGLTEFTKWSDDIIELTGPVADADSLRFVISQTLMNTKPDAARIPKAFFVNTLRNAACKQLASYTFQEIKNNQRARAEAEAKKAQEEQTALETAATSEQQ